MKKRFKQIQRLSWKQIDPDIQVEVEAAIEPVGEIEPGP